MPVLFKNRHKKTCGPGCKFVCIAQACLLHMNIELPDCVLVRQTGLLSNLTQNDITLQPGHAMSVTSQPVLLTTACTSRFHFTMNNTDKKLQFCILIYIYMNIYIYISKRQAWMQQVSRVVDFGASTTET